MNDGSTIVQALRASANEIRANRDGKRGGDNARLPSAIPGADHDRDREHDQAALHYVGEQEGRDESARIMLDGQRRRIGGLKPEPARWLRLAK